MRGAAETPTLPAPRSTRRPAFVARKTERRRLDDSRLSGAASVFPEAAKKALCEVPPVRLKCEGGKMPKCLLIATVLHDRRKLLWRVSLLRAIGLSCAVYGFDSIDFLHYLPVYTVPLCRPRSCPLKMSDDERC